VAGDDVDLETFQACSRARSKKGVSIRLAAFTSTIGTCNVKLHQFF